MQQQNGLQFCALSKQQSMVQQRTAPPRPHAPLFVATSSSVFGSTSTSAVRNAEHGQYVAVGGSHRVLLEGVACLVHQLW